MHVNNLIDFYSILRLAKPQKSIGKLTGWGFSQRKKPVKIVNGKVSGW